MSRMKVKITTVSLDPQDWTEFRKWADEKRLPASQLLRMLMQDFNRQERKAARADRTRV
jgi:hypothetical protein